MARVAGVLRWMMAIIVVVVVAWAFFDMGRRFVEHRSQLADRPIELTVMHWGDPREDAIVARLCDTFEKDHAKVRIVRINPGASDFANKLKTMLSADIPPDVFYLPPDLLPDLAQAKLLAPLDQYFDAEPKAFKDDFWPILLKAFRYDRDKEIIGRGPLYALPKDFTTAVFYANTDLFDKAGIDWRSIQKNGWTWNDFETETKKIRGLNNDPTYKGREIFGSLIQTWPVLLQSMFGQYGGSFFATNPDGTPDFKTLALTQPGAQRVLEMIHRVRVIDRTAFNTTGIAKDGGQEFLNGNIGCIGPVGRWLVPTYKSIDKFKWDVLPMPHGTEPSGPSFYTGWTMSSHTKFPKESYELLSFLCGRDGQVQQAREGLAIPALQSVANSDDFLKPPGLPPHDSQLFLDAAKDAKLAQFPRQAEFVRLVDQDMNLTLQADRLTPMEAAKALQKDWTAELNSPLRRHAWPVMPWRTILAIAAAALATVIGILWVRARREQLGAIDRAAERAGFLFIAPWIIGFVCLTFGPMIVSLLLAFSRWTGLVPLGQAEFVGFANFSQLFTYDPAFFQSIKVTAYFVILGVPVSQLAALLIAMLMNNKVRGITLFRTIYFVPSVVSGAALAVLWLQLFNNDYGLINNVLKPIAHFLGTNPPNWFGYDLSTGHSVNDAARWAVPAFVIMGLWGVGGGMIIYLAGLKGIPQSLYEAARIDGANPLRQAWNITIPMLSPLIFYNMVMGIIGSFQVFTQAYIMTGPGPEDSTNFYVLHLYRQAFEFHNMGYASAMAWVLFLLVLALTLFVFRASKNLVYYEGLR